MVRKIRLRGHVIRLYEVPPGTSRSIPKSCPSCNNMYDNGVYRQSVYLCCGIENCFYCVLNKNKSRCPFIETRFLQERIVLVDLTQEESESEGELDSDVEISEFIVANVKLPELSNERPQKFIVDSERKKKPEVSPLLNEKISMLTEIRDTVNPEKSSELNIKMTNQSRQTEPCSANVKIPAMSNEEQREAPLSLEMNMKPITIELSTFLENISKENSCKSSTNNSDDHIEENGSDENCPIQRLRDVASIWRPVAHNVDKEILSTSNSPGDSPSNKDQGISRLRNGKVFARKNIED